MSIKIRLARSGSKKRPFYRIVAADSRMPRDGRFLERLGTYNPLLPKDSEDRIKLDMDRVQHWLGRGAQPTDRISRFLESAGVMERRTRSNPKKAVPGEKAQKRAEERAARATSAEEAPTERPQEAPAETPQEAPAEAPSEVPAGTPQEAPAGSPEEAPAEEGEKKSAAE